MSAAETEEYPAFPTPRACPFHTTGQDARTPVGDGRPVSRITLPTGKNAWLITGHAYVRQILTDSRVSSRRSAPGFPQLNQVPTRELPKSTPPLIGLDPPEHTVHRRMVINEFTVRRLRSLRPRIQEIADACVDDVVAADRPADLVRILSGPLPSMVICELLGVPSADRAYFQDRARVLVDRNTTADAARGPLIELVGYMDKLVQDKEQHPGDDLIGRLIAKYRAADLYDHHFMVKTSVLLLNAGHETTSNMISLGVVALLENPGQLADLRNDSSLMPNAIEELLRYFSVVDHTMARVALEDIEIGGETIRAGEGLIALPSTANRDEEVFDQPDTLDIHRDHVRQHVAFGYGNHQCLGQNLARVELDVVLGTLFERIPALRLAVPVEELRFKDEGQVYGVHELPVTW